MAIGELTNLPSTRTGRRGVVQQSSPLLAREVEVQSAQWPHAPNGDGNLLGHSKDDASVQEDPTPDHVANVDERRPLVPSLTSTEPHITNVAAARTATVIVRDNQRILVRVLISQPRPLASNLTSNDLPSAAYCNLTERLRPFERSA